MKRGGGDILFHLTVLLQTVLNKLTDGRVLLLKWVLSIPVVIKALHCLALWNRGGLLSSGFCSPFLQVSSSLLASQGTVAEYNSVPGKASFLLLSALLGFLQQLLQFQQVQDPLNWGSTTQGSGLNPVTTVPGNSQSGSFIWISSELENMESKGRTVNRY